MARGRQNIRGSGGTASERIGAEIRNARVAAGLTQRELASRLNRHPSWISRVETARRSLLVHDLPQIAAALGVDEMDLLSRALRRAR